MMTFELRDVTFAYPAKQGSGHKVFDSLHLAVRQGECVGILGHEGAGKTTLLQCMAGLLRPVKGSILVDGINILEQKQSVSHLRRRIGFAFQFPEQQFFCDTVEKELCYTRDMLSGNDTHGYTTPATALESLGLDAAPYLHRSPFSLSMGEARRVALASLLVTNPDAMLLDEPSVGLDGAGVDVVVTLLRRLRSEGKTLVVVSHDVDLLAEVVSRVIIMQQGCIKEDGDVKTIFTNGELLAAHGYDLPEVVRIMRDVSPEQPGFYTFREAEKVLQSMRNR